MCGAGGMFDGWDKFDGGDKMNSDTNDYPTDEELETIKNWDFNKKSVLDFLAFIHSCWHWADGPGWHGYHLTGKNVLRLELHTGGWSGNESIINVMQDNFIFWVMCWEKSIKGGHYYFRISLKAFKK